ncbi:MAG: cytochrome b/b6 domain-containing protein [Deltaproteobacteria bacterium]|jgi:cytochrome b subunit of formate dehydrogenase|nr:cytochrome b/b6 domain-containing protein [Deltaproteobacteria bacterium]
MKKRPDIKIKNGKKYFFKFTPLQRAQHITIASCVIVLVLTGMPLKFHEAFWAQPIYALFGGIKMAPVVHKIAGTVLLLLFVFHLAYVVYSIFADLIIPLHKKKELKLFTVVKTIVTHPIMPSWKDVRDIIDLLKYLLFMTNERPAGDKFTWKEKFDYWAPFWGIVIMVSTGIIMWQKEFVTRFLPGEVINLALIAHSDEALLAALFLFIWHFYNVHFSTSVFPMGTVFLTGYLPEHLMVEEHYEYYQKVMKAAGLEDEILAPDGAQRKTSGKAPQATREISIADLPRVS